MAKYIYLSESSFLLNRRDYVETHSLKAAIQVLSNMAAENNEELPEGDLNSHIIDERFFRNNFRKSSMVKVGQTFENRIGDSFLESSYNIYRYRNKSDIPAYLAQP